MYDFFIQLATILLLMFAYNLIQHKVLQEKYHLLFASVASAAVIAWGLAVLDLTLSDLGVTNFVSGLLYGGGLAIIITISIATAAKHNRTGSFFEDTRVLGVRPKNLLKKTLVEIPITTVLFEEILFRGLLVGYFLTQTSDINAILLSSVLFGFWHILPALNFAKTNKAAQGLPVITIIGTIIFTTLTGMAFAWLRVVSGSILAPMLIHFASNSGGYMASWLRLNVKA